MRFPSEKSRGDRIYEEKTSFSDWINRYSSVDLQLNGASFTWSNRQSSPTMPRLERFLVSNDWMEMNPDVWQSALPKPASDHCPSLLDSNYERWGPAPFRFEIMWLEEKDFPNLIKEWWMSFSVEGWAGHGLAIKLKMLKQKIKEWVRSRFGDVGVIKANLLEEIQKLDRKEEGSTL